MTVDASRAARFVGQSVKRREDPRLVSGGGTYVDDLKVAGVGHVAFVRSNVARGRITRLDVTAARQMEGVRAVYTAADLNHRAKAMWASMFGPAIEDGGVVPYAPFRVLADEDVRFVGDPIAVVVADSRYLAEDAADLVEVDVEPQIPVIDVLGAAANPELVHPEKGTNVAEELPVVEIPGLDDAFAAADRVITRTFHQARSTNVPMETRGLIVEWSPLSEQMRIYASTQAPHELRAYAARLTGINENNIRVTMYDVGGGFGQKVFVSRDEAAIVLTAQVLGGSVKWIEDRRESLLVANQAREDIVTVSFAVTNEGKVLAAKVDETEDAGAYPPGGTGFTASMAAMMFPGPYKIPLIDYRARAVFTNTCGRAALRGPWMTETFAREQMMDHVAHELGLDPVEIRLRNIIRAEDLPYTLPSLLVYDVVTPFETLNQATEMIGYEAFRAEQAAARLQGRYLGLGVSVFIEPSAVSFGVLNSEQATIRIEPSGKVIVLMSTASHGHSVETTMPQIVADELGCDLDDVVLMQGDTTMSGYGHGTGGSRTAVIAGGAASGAAVKLRAKLLELAGHMLEASPDDLEIANSVVSVKGTPAKALPFAQIAAVAYMVPDMLPPGFEPGLEVTHRFAPSQLFTFSNATHICVCEVDVETGAVKLLRYVVSEDCGRMINPMVVEGQIAGGVVQGIGGVLFEHLVYDEDGNPLATTFLDYLIPTAPEVPELEYGHIETIATTNPGGFKGMGEGGAIGAPSAVINAVADALVPFGVSPTELPLHPSRIMTLLGV